MSGNGKTMRKDQHMAVILEPDGSMTERGLRILCPHCGHVGVHMGYGHVNIWSVGAEELRECTKCRKRFHMIRLTVLPGEDPREFYRRILEGLGDADENRTD